MSGESFNAADRNTQIRLGLLSSNKITPAEPERNAAEMVAETIASVKATNGPMRIKQFKHVQATVSGAFFDAVCQVVGVIVPKCDTVKRVFLRVSDGTCVNSEERNYEVNDTNIDEEKSRIDKHLTDLLWQHSSNCILDIGCYDEFADEALKFGPGDIVKMTNLRAKTLDSVSLVTLNGNGKHGHRFNRGISLLAKQGGWKPKDDDNANGDNDEVSSENNSSASLLLPISESVGDFRDESRGSEFLEDEVVSESPTKN